MGSNRTFCVIRSDKLAAVLRTVTDPDAALVATVGSAHAAVLNIVGQEAGWSGWLVPASVTCQGQRKMRLEWLRGLTSDLTVTESQVAAAFGPQWRAVVRICEQVEALTDDEIVRLKRIKASLGGGRPEGRTVEYRYTFLAVYATCESHPLVSRRSLVVQHALDAALAVVHWDLIDLACPAWADEREGLMAAWVEVLGRPPVIDTPVVSVKA